MLRAGAGIVILLVLGCASTSKTPPCGGSQPLGCSIPTAVLVVSKDYEEGTFVGGALETAG